MMKKAMPRSSHCSARQNWGGWGQVWQELGLTRKPDDEPHKDAKDKPAKPTQAPKVKLDKKEKPEKQQRVPEY